MAKLILYSYFRSSASYRVRIALNLKKIPYDIKAVHLLKSGGQQHSQSYKQLNPAAQVPTLIDGNFVISESMAIIDYIENQFGGVKLFPADPKSRAQVLRFCEVINSGMQPLGNLKVTQFLDKKFPGQPTLREEWIQTWIGKGMKVLEELLEQHAGTYSFGGQVTAADVFLVPMVFSAQRFKVNLRECPNVLRVNDACLKLDAFKNAHPSKQPDFED